jgi:2-(1,2-epoxy-1,2-dihydrophenyl)acetyl-CoA isomerase
MELETIRFERRGAVVTLALDRPKAFNALNLQMCRDLFAAVAACDEDAGVRAVILTGSGEKAFCAGGDIPGFKESLSTISDLIKQMTTYLHGAISRMTRMRKPVIAAINGVAAGAGMGLVMAADVAVAAERATFTMAYTGIGATPDGSTTFFLPRLVGTRRALELSLTNRTLTAREALEWGLVNRVAPDQKLPGEVFAMAECMAAGPTGAYAGVKRLVYRSLENGLESQMEDETQTLAAEASRPDFREGVSAFLEKRRPEFKG